MCVIRQSFWGVEGNNSTGHIVNGHRVFKWASCVQYDIEFSNNKTETLLVGPLFVCLFVFGATDPPPHWAMASSFTSFLNHTQRPTTVGRTPLDE